MKKLNIDDKVANPNTSDKSPNYIGIVTRVYFFIIEKRKSWFANVQFRDYDGGYSFDILKKINNQ